MTPRTPHDNKRNRTGRDKADEQLRDMPEDFFEKCPSCRAMLYQKDLIRHLWVCTKCSYHFDLTVAQRIEITADPGSFVEFDAGITAGDPLEFPDYADRLARYRERSQAAEALVTGRAKIEGQPIILGVMNRAFLAATMGHVVGEKVARALERAADEGLPLVMFCASGGARVDEGLIALMQMPKTCAAVGRLNEAAVPYITVLTNPTYAGVMASFASLGDVILAEPGAGIGFTGPRVIELSLKRRGPFKWQTAAFMYEHGLIDLVVPRPDLKPTLGRLLGFLGSPEPAPEGPSSQEREAP